MKTRIVVAFSLCFIMQQMQAGFSLPNTPSAVTNAPKRNIIFSSVANNTSQLPAKDMTDVLSTPMITAAPMPQEPKPLSVTSISTTVPKQLPKIMPSSSVVAKKIAEPVVIVDTPEQVIAQKQADSIDIENQKSLEQNNVQPVAKDLVDVKEQIEQATQTVKEPGVLYQTSGFIEDDPATIAFNFEEANLQNLISYMEAVHNIKFISEDIVPTAKDAKGVAGHKITFRTNRNLTRKESWDLCVTFLHIAGLNVAPMSQQGFYRLVPLAKANNEPIPTYIGVDADVLPETDMIVRYVYFARNVDPSKIQPILKNMQSGSAKIDVYAPLKGLIFTDRANSIKSLMKIVTELDRAALPEVLSVVKLKHANVEDVITLYTSLKPSAASLQPQRVWVNSKKESSIEYFPQDVVMVPYTRMNSLILLGTAKDVQRIEEFITKYVDVAIDRQAPPLFTYRLQYTNAKDMTDLLTKMVGYGQSTPAGQYGGVRDNLKYFQKMSVIADSWTNSLIINATQDDYLALKPLIEELDVPQKQVGLEVLFVQVKDVDVKTLGAQISGPNGQNAVVDGASLFGPTFMPGVTAQTSGVPQGSPIVVTHSGSSTTEDFSIKSSLARLLGNNLVNEVGSILVTFGKPIWALFKVLKTITSTHIIANPFVVVSNNSTAVISSGEQRRLVSGEVISSSAVKATGLTPIDANLTVTITPMINKGSVVNLNIKVENSQFTQSVSTQNSPRDSKVVQTVASVANGETLVLGGIMVENYASTSTGVPFLEHIPVFGWFFKSKTRSVTRDHFLIFICPRLLDPLADGTDIDQYTNYKLHEAQQHIDLIDETDWFTSGKDPVQKAFFGTPQGSHTLQEVYTGKQFATRAAIDGKIDKLSQADQRVALRKEMLARKKKNKHKKSVDKAFREDQKLRMPSQNSISNSVALTQGAGNVA